MREHRYIAERHGRKTYLKGSFTGRFVGRLDPYRSDARHEHFFDIEVTEGAIVSRQDQVTPWQEGAEHPDFVNESTFQVNPQGHIQVALHYPDGSVKYFKVGLKQIKLIRCGLSEKTYSRDEVRGMIRGDVSGYILHHDTALDEIKEQEPVRMPPQPDKKEMWRATPSGTSSIVENNGSATSPVPPNQGFNLLKVAVLSAVGLLGANLAVSGNIFPLLFCFLLGGLAVGWLYKGLSGKLSPRNGQLAAILLFCLLFAGGLGWFLSHTVGGEKKTPAQIISLRQNAETLLAGKDYGQALRVFDNLIDGNGGGQELLYKRALCYVGLGQIGEAVADLKPAVEQGMVLAKRLYDSINPVKKRQIGTRIRCNDGWISPTREKHKPGTCSHHGGVKDWDEPVYEEYREY